MNIAYYSHYFSPEIGAPSARIQDMADQWIDLGHEVQVVTCFPNHPTGRLYPGYRPGRYLYEAMSGISVHRHWTYITPNKGFLKKSMGHLSFIPGSMLFSQRHVAGPDIVIGSSPTFFAAMAGAGLARKRRAPFVMEVRDLWPAIFVELGVLKNRLAIDLLEKWEMSLYRRASRVVTVTDAFRDNIIARGIPEEKVVTITNGADVDFWKPAEKPVGLMRSLDLEGRFVALYIGAHGISQALSRIIDSADLLKEEAGIRFLFVGEGAEKEQLQTRCREKGLENVIFLDPVDKATVKEYYALADVCLVPLRDIPLFDTFIPSKMFEIMAMGRPIVGSVRGEAAGILDRSGGAVVVGPEDSRGIARAVMDLYQDPAGAETMGHRARTFVERHYSRKVLAGRYLDVLAGAVDEWPASAT